jgi:hypothetical protein
MNLTSKAIAVALFLGVSVASAQQTPPPTATTPPPTATTPPPTPTTPPAATTAAPPAPPPPVAIKPAAPPPPVQRRVTTPVVVSGAIGAAGLGTGIIFGILAAGKNQSYKKTPDNQVALDGERNAFISDVAFGVAALFGLTAIALYMLPDEPQPSATGSNSTSASTGNVAKFNVKTWVSSALKGEVLSF